MATNTGLPDGWTRVQMQLPAATAAYLRAAMQDVGFGSQRLIGTAAILLFLSLNSEVRHAMIDEVSSAARRDPNALGPPEIAAALTRLAEAGEGSHIIQRIIDPELSPMPGSKLSDRAAKVKKKGA